MDLTVREFFSFLAFTSEQYWYGRFLFYRGLFLTYFVAFLVAFNQFCPLAGEHGLLPFTQLLETRSFLENPTLFHFVPTDYAVRVVTVTGMILSGIGLLGVEWAGPLAVGFCLFVLWGLYLSLLKAGRLFYGFGWESFLVETGFLAIFLGGAYQPVPMVGLFLIAWLLFRVMFGAGLIKLRGDQCWWDLTCMDYHYETQPMPNPLSWFFHHFPTWWHKLEVLGNHFVEIFIPFLYFFPQPYAGVAGLATAGFQGWLMLSGNFSWLNFLTIVVALPLIPDYFMIPVFGSIAPSTGSELPLFQHVVTCLYALLVLVFSYWPVKNFFSERQLMNASFDPLNLVNTYGAFGSITKTRYELVVQGRTVDGKWQTYKYKGKPTDVSRCPSQWAPYHLRLDWQMWFAAMRSRPRYWVIEMINKLLQNDPQFTQLLLTNPFEGSDPPHEVRVLRFKYSYTDISTWWESGNWWTRKYVDELIPPTDRAEIRRHLR